MARIARLVSTMMSVPATAGHVVGAHPGAVAKSAVRATQGHNLRARIGGRTLHRVGDAGQ
jgi:hypothetical protein